MEAEGVQLLDAVLIVKESSRKVYVKVSNTRSTCAKGLCELRRRLLPSEGLMQAMMDQGPQAEKGTRLPWKFELSPASRFLHASVTEVVGGA